MNLDYITNAQSSKEITANALFDAAAPSMAFGRRAAGCVALTWAYYGSDRSTGNIANGSINLTASATNYIEVDTASAVVSSNTTGFSGGSKSALYKVITDASSVTSWTDVRQAYAATFATNMTTIPILDKTSGYSPVLADAGYVIRINSASAVSFTLNTNANVAYPIGTILIVRGVGTGTVTIAGVAGVTINYPDSLQLRKQYSECRLHKVGTDTWELTGDMV